MPPTETVLRPAEPTDADAIADLYRLARQHAVPAIPPPVHDAEDDRVYFAALLTGPAEVWLAEPADGGPPLAFLAVTDDWVHSLYVRPGLTGQGLGSALLEVAKARRPDGFALWVFESNAGARRFYARHGLVPVRRTDGAGNEERSPDIQMVWPGAEPVASLRRYIDDLDADLARLLELRSGLTAAVQQYKSAAERDPGREAAIVARMAPLAPRLGPQRLARIMHVVISESLDAAG